MRNYSKVSPRFWIGNTGRQIRALGAQAQVVALYLLSCPSSNMIGIYYLPLTLVAHETGMPLEGASEALRRLCSVGFAAYDHDSEVVWVPEMAAHQIDEELKPDDKRVKGIEKEVEAYRKSVFFNEFIARYRDRFHLTNALNEGAKQDPAKGHRSPSEAPPKPGAGAGTGTRTGTEQEHPHPPDADPPAKRKTAMPKDFGISDRVRKWATEKGYDRLDEHLASFTAKCKAKGYRYIDWDAAFEEAIRADWAKLRPAARVLTLAEQRAKRMAEITGMGEGYEQGRIIDITPDDRGAVPALPSDLRGPDCLDVG